MVPFITILTLSIISFFAGPSTGLGGTVSLSKEQAWSTMRECARGCLHGGYIDGLAGYGMGCPEPRPNDCFCRTDLYSVATSFVSSCVTKGCTIGDPGPDYKSAMYLYDSYCQANGYTASDALNMGIITATEDSKPTVTRVTIVTQTVVSGSRTITTESTITAEGRVTIDITSTTTVTGNRPVHDGAVGSESTGGLSLSDKIALGVGIGIGLPATIATVVMCCLGLGRRQRI